MTLGGIVCIPPENSNHFNEDKFIILENEVTSFCSENEVCFTKGDFNVKRFHGKQQFLSDYFDFDSETFVFFYVN